MERAEDVSSKDGTPIALWRSGAGPPLLLVHGTTAEHSRWATIAPRLETQATVYAMDRRGRGGSGDSSDYSLQREFEDVAAVVDAIGEPVSLLGHSFGALCCMEAALLSDRVARLILYEPPISTGPDQYPPGFPDRMQAHIDAGNLETALETFFREVVKMPEHELRSYRQLPPWRTRVQLAPTVPREIVAAREYDFVAARYDGLQIPALLLLGGDSPPLFSRAIEVLSEALPHNRVVVLPGQQHIAMDTAPDLFVAETLHFLQDEA
jgi:pimeloyl-ACP methyl ester carboxylesterase